MPLLRSRRRSQFLILLVDIAILFGSLFLALVIRSGSIPSPSVWLDHFRAFSLAFAGWVIVFYTAGLYALEFPFDGARFSARLFAAVAISTLGTALMFYLDREADIAPKTLLALVAAVSYVALGIWRFTLGRASRALLPKTGVAFVGATEEAATLIGITIEKPYLGYESRLIFDMDRSSTVQYPVPQVHGPAEFKAALADDQIDIVVITDESKLDPEARRALFSVLGKNLRFMRLPGFYEMLLRRIPIGAINEAWFLENLDLPAKRFYEVAKRGIDLVMAAILLLLTAPIWPLLAIGIKLGSKGPVFFKQIRLGRDDRPFEIYKFRTMRIEGNTFIPTGERDPRITPLGALLRATRLDELPQMINIFRGEMSFVGPRPERPELALELEKAIPFYRQRHLVKPGVTGWDQVSGEYHSPSIEDTYKKLQYDLYYVKNMSLFLDISVFFKTIMTVLARAGR